MLGEPGVGWFIDSNNVSRINLSVVGKLVQMLNATWKDTIRIADKLLTIVFS